MPVCTGRSLDVAITAKPARSSNYWNLEAGRNRHQEIQTKACDHFLLCQTHIKAASQGPHIYRSMKYFSN